MPKWSKALFPGKPVQNIPKQIRIEGKVGIEPHRIGWIVEAIDHASTWSHQSVLGEHVAGHIWVLAYGANQRSLPIVVLRESFRNNLKLIQLKMQPIALEQPTLAKDGEEQNDGSNQKKQPSPWKYGTFSPRWTHASL
jgi:hypothetical protein